MRRKFLAQLADEHVDDLNRGFVLAAIEMAQDHILRQRVSLAERQQLEDFILAGGEVEWPAVQRRRSGVEIDREPARTDDRLGWPLGPPNDRLDPRLHAA